MSDKTIPDMKEVFRQASEIAQQVPENMQVAAFNRALDLLTEHSDSTSGPNPPHAKPAARARASRVPRTKPDSGSSVDTLLSLIDTTQHPAVASAKKVLDRSLMVLQIALRNHDVDGLTPPEIARVLTEKFRLNTSSAAVNMALGPATTLVNRISRGQAYEYRIMGPGEEYLSHLGSRVELPEEPASTRPRKGGKRSTKAVHPTPKLATSRSSRPGPKRILETLITEKFFDTPRNIGQMIEHIRQRSARAYKATDLSPALTRLRRDDRLDRTKNDKGIYQYIIHR